MTSPAIPKEANDAWNEKYDIYAEAWERANAAKNAQEVARQKVVDAEKLSKDTVSPEKTDALKIAQAELVLATAQAKYDEALRLQANAELKAAASEYEKLNPEASDEVKKTSEAEAETAKTEAGKAKPEGAKAELDTAKAELSELKAKIFEERQGDWDEASDKLLESQKAETDAKAKVQSAEAKLKEANDGLNAEGQSPKPETQEAVQLAQAELTLATAEAKLAEAQVLEATAVTREAALASAKARDMAGVKLGDGELTARENAAEAARKASNNSKPDAAQAEVEKTQAALEHVKKGIEAAALARASPPDNPPKPAAETVDIFPKKSEITIPKLQAVFTEVKGYKVVDSGAVVSIRKMNETTKKEEKYIDISKKDNLVSGFLGEKPGKAEIEQLAADMIKAYKDGGGKGPVLIKGENEELKTALEEAVRAADLKGKIVANPKPAAALEDDRPEVDAARRLGNN